GEHRIERGHRLLEDHRDLFAADLSHLGRGQIEEASPAVVDRALDDAARGLRDQAHDREGRNALPGAGLADDAERLALVDVKIDPVDGADNALVGVEIRLQPFDLEQSFGHGAPWSYHARVISTKASPARAMSSASISLWVTHRIAAGPIAWIFTLRAAHPATSSAVAAAAAAGPPRRPAEKNTLVLCTPARWRHAP